MKSSLKIKDYQNHIPFIKMHGTGNDFVLIDVRHNNYSDLDYKKIANRKTGIGCDQVIIISVSTKADCMMTIYNADGSSAEMCGNAARCVADLIISEKGDVTIELMNQRIIYGERLSNGQIKINMGKPLLNWDGIPISIACDTLFLPIEIGPLKNPVGVNIGNPHAIFFVDDISTIPFEELAPKLEKHVLFPNGANVSIAEISDEKQINLKVWERGVGITDSCGSAACAAFVAAVRRGYIDKKEALVTLLGGDLFIELDEEDNVFMTGEIAYVFYGTLIK